MQLVTGFSSPNGGITAPTQQGATSVDVAQAHLQIRIV